MVSSIFGVLALILFFIFVTGIILGICEIEIFKFKNSDTNFFLVVGSVILSAMCGIVSWIFQ